MLDLFLTLPCLIALIAAYLLGAVPFGLLLTKAAGLGDIRAIGSGNIGTTNVLRTGRKDLAALTLVLDALKATFAILIAAQWGEAPALCAALGAFVGHLYPVWLGFKGGKGVATLLGVLLGLFWPAALAFIVVWLATARLSRYSSLAGMLACATAPFFLLAMHQAGAAAFTFIMAILVLIKHRENIARLRAGTESRIGQKKSMP
jgi:acyl phosphate:glycerol-3-phosphate acyltransferase